MMDKKFIYKWYVLHTKSRFENVVNDGLSKKSIEVFSPKIQVKSRRRDRKLLIMAPLFPGYVFVKTDLNPYEHIEILKTAGSVKLIGDRKGPVSVPEDAVDSLKIMVSGDQTVTTGSRLKRGNRIMVVTGPFAGVIGFFVRYKGNERVVVNIEALGQFATVEVNEDEVEVLDKIYI